MSKADFFSEAKKRVINLSATILEALSQMDAIEKKLLLVYSGDNFKGLLSIGDIQRAIIKKVPLNTPVGNILRKKIRVAKPGDSFEAIKDLMVKYKTELLPVVDDNNEVVNIYFWEDIFEHPGPESLAKFDLPVVIMAGGRGERLKPITNIIPKPLIPIGEKPIIEWIVDSFAGKGVNKFYFTVNYKREMLQRYFDELPGKKYSISYFEEALPLGTAGSLHLLKGIIKETFFVTNCDILINNDYSQILNYHRNNKNDLTAVAAIKNFNIPYGIFETKENGLMSDFKEKPEYNFLVNAGMYILEPALLDLIPENKFFHITDLMALLQKGNGRVGVFPVSEGSWMDIGDWTEYNKTLERLKMPAVTFPVKRG